jgi:hypothetical protein
MQKAKNGNFEHMLPQKAIREVGASRRRTIPEYQSRFLMIAPPQRQYRPSILEISGLVPR